MVKDFSRASFDKKRHIFISLNDFCRHRCTYCYLKEEKLSRSKLISINTTIDNLSRLYNEHGYRLLTISGGEPGLVSNLTSIIEKISNIGFRIIVNTNGTLSKQRIIEIQRFNIIAISLALIAITR